MNTEQKQKIQSFIKKICMVAISIITIKLIRVYLKSNQEIRDDIHLVFKNVSEIQLSHAIGHLFLFSLILGCLALLVGFSFYRYTFLEKKICSFIILFLIVDSVFYYIFPEIPISILRSVLLTTS
ncbi:hypothetical protein P9Y62_02340 [Bacillus thuringiensis]|uniref:Uncharacterized protein n=1 Tax=Bacillus thuringiensis HD-771 TaxID=1218175 RepID=A0A9W3P0Y2_BACTU|nr:hypothetical protein [Bacillus thuringiensis]MCU5406867.1 hypothetical protein [Bacillus cereus]AFQ19640.1 hypothetical protein BTG_31518 [Bacillus thuringiensis HD-771]MEB4892196.1 hypothetical protein [Bacillus thuringiensis]MEC2643987.1 hypothetical protein [Bacillus thuringiensis]MEC2725632.1 hypothetical protein [Bacillus thuringiensis]